MTDIITLEEYKQYQGLTKMDQDAKLSLVIASASNIIKTYIGDIFTPTTSPIVEYISVDYDTNRIYPRYYPINSIISVEESDRYTTDSTVHVPLQTGTQFYLDDDSIVRVPGSLGFANWPISPGTVKVTYTGGYSLLSTPADLKLACIELVNYYVNKDFVPSRTLQGATIINPTGGTAELPAHVRTILDGYSL
jgi:Phage gp6-like head-tail connector protein